MKGQIILSFPHFLTRDLEKLTAFQQKKKNASKVKIGPTKHGKIKRFDLSIKPFTVVIFGQA